MEYLPSYVDGLYLAHHGIKGQKWGVRRYQNLDGSLTALGRIHYGVGKRYSRYSKIEKQDLSMTAKLNNVKLYRHDSISLANANQSDLYDKSTGLLRKEGPSSIEDDIMKVNPQLGNGPGGKTRRQYSVNCTLCSSSYVMRRKGYDVCAKPMTNPNGATIEDISKWFPDAEKRFANSVCDNGYSNVNTWELQEKDLVKINNKSMDHMFKNSRDYEKRCKEQGERIISECESCGPNAYGIIGFRLAGQCGHAIAFENDANSKTRLIDTQVANMKHCKPTHEFVVENEMKYADPYFGATIFRCDNATPDYNKLKKTVVSNPTLVNIERKNGDTVELKMYQDRSKDMK